MAIKQGDKVKVEYKGTLDDGTVFDNSEGREPLEFEVGSGQIIKGFDDAVVGMDKDQEKDIHIKCEDAYGKPQPGLVQAIPRDKLPPEPAPQVGMGLMLNTPQGPIPARIAEVQDATVKIDLNHPLAGKDLNFHIKIVEVTSA